MAAGATRVKQVFLLMGPSTLGLAVNQINVMVNSMLALWVGMGALGALYAERLIYLPQGMLAVSLGTVLLPVLSDLPLNANTMKCAPPFIGLRTLLFVMTPAAIGLFALARPIVRLLFERGTFDPMSTELTARALTFYAPGLMVFCLAKVFVPAFYALKDTRTPVKIGLCSVALNFSLNVTFALTLPEYWRHAGMAFATVIAEGFNGLMLAYFLRRRLGPLGLRGILGGFSRAFVAAILMAVVAFTAEHFLTDGLMTGAHLSRKISHLIGVPTAIVLGMGVYFGSARLFRVPELGFVLEALRSRRSSRASVPASDAAP